ncbi:tripartite tricarboxylate transporter substrate binding protein [Salibacterium aidingense]|uniref:tripartite tricarboxylate transporter substrate binding protein n=1 Tax=Salibacterium aidingense TaxID=384933 RepID=UPI003BE2C4B9
MRITKFSFFLFLLCYMLLMTACQDESASSSESNESSKSEDNSYPEETIEIYVPFDPGGPTDNSARIVAEEMPDILGEDIAVVNQTGGGGNTAINSVVNSDSEGYDFFYGHQALFSGIATGNIEYELSDLTPITTFSSSTQALVVSSNSGWEDLDDVVEAAEEKPDEYNLATDFGGATHFLGGMFLEEADIDINMVEAGAESERMSSILGGQVDMTFTSGSNAAEYQESGDFNVLGVFADEGDVVLPDVPTASEQGYDVDFPITHVLYGPADLDDSVVEAWNKATEQLTQDEGYTESLNNIGHQHEYKTQEETGQFVEENFQYIEDLKGQLGY